MIPKIIWTYWDKHIIPDYIQDCLNTWKKHCKNNWSINILNKETIKFFLEEEIDYPENIFIDGPQHQSDMFGVALVNKYGGIWMDANIIMLKPIEFMLDNEWFGYYDKTPEAFLFASNRHSYTINKIHKLFFDVFSIEKDKRNTFLKQQYSIDDTYLYPQKLINYLVEKDQKIKNTITSNSLNQWETIYSLIMVLSKYYKLKNKSELFTFLINNEDNIPDIILKQPLIKLQGSSQQSDYKINKNSWWYQLTNK